MKNRSVLLLLSLLLALVTAGGAVFWLKNQQGQPTKKVEDAVLWVAKDTIPAGTEITEKLIEKKNIPKADLPTSILNTSEDIVGKTTKETILKGESISEARVYTEEDKELSMMLKPGYRAFAVTMTQYSAVGDLIKAGDKVDIFAYLKEIEKNQVIIRPDMATLVLQNIEVLAVRKELRKDTAPPEEIPDIFSVTLAVPIKGIEKLILAEETGIVKMALRPFGDNGTYTSYGVIWQEMILDSNQSVRDLFPEYPVQEDTNVINQVIPNQVPVEPAEPAEPAEGSPQSGTESPEGIVPSNSAVTPTEPTASTPAETEYTYYTVQYGDTLMKISKKFFDGNASYYDEIMKANDLKNSIIRPGQKLKIPTGR